MILRDDFDGSYLYGREKFTNLTGRVSYQKHAVTLRDRYVDSTTGLLKRELAAERNCPLCSSKERHELFVKKGFPHNHCLSCGMVYVAPILREETSAKDYRHGNLYKGWNKVMMDPLNVKLDKIRYKYCIESLINVTGFTFEGKSVLDVGCGMGLFLEVCLELRAKCYGLELNRSAAEIARQKGLDVCEEFIEQCPFEENSFNLISLWTVLEHIPEPLIMLDAIWKLLCPSGVLLIEVPNLDGLATRLLGPSSTTFAGDQHINFFNAHTLTFALEKTGFKKLAVDSYISEMDTIRTLFYKKKGKKFTKEILPLFSTDWLNDNLLGHRLFTIAQKA